MAPDERTDDEGGSDEVKTEATTATGLRTLPAARVRGGELDALLGDTPVLLVERWGSRHGPSDHPHGLRLGDEANARIEEWDRPTVQIRKPVDKQRVFIEEG